MADWVKVDEALRRFQISRATLYRLISRGAVTRVRRAGDAHVYVSQSDLQRATSLPPHPLDLGARVVSARQVRKSRPSSPR